MRFSGKILPPDLSRTRTIAELLPWLYRKGISTSDFPEALAAPLDRPCLRVIIGATEDGKKELLAIQDGVRESGHS